MWLAFVGVDTQVGSLASKPKRDLLMNDFWELETISFPPEGSSLTPAHHYSEFRFKIYAPIAFRYFRGLFGIQPDDFMVSAAVVRWLIDEIIFNRSVSNLISDVDVFSTIAGAIKSRCVWFNILFDRR